MEWRPHCCDVLSPRIIRSRTRTGMIRRLGSGCRAEVRTVLACPATPHPPSGDFVSSTHIRSVGLGERAAMPLPPRRSRASGLAKMKQLDLHLPDGAHYDRN